MIWQIILGIIALLIPVTLWFLGRENEKTIFFTLTLTPVIATFVITTLVFTLSPSNILIGGLILVERILWSSILFETAGEQRLGWYILIYLIPFMWLVYAIVELR